MTKPTTDRPLFAQFPPLAHSLPWVRLADLPTPVDNLPQLAAELGVGNLLIKRDDLSGLVYGGNKIRKLEFLLGDALEQGAREVLTFGCAGSNHATATAIYAHQLGLRNISMLLPQPNARSVRRNLLMSCAHNAELHFFRTSRSVATGVRKILERRAAKNLPPPVIIPAGGSSPLGAIGYVNAAIELQGQIAQGLLPKPDVIYVAGGTTGTAAGLILGLRAVGMDIPVVIVRVTAESFVNAPRVLELLQQTHALLKDRDPQFPDIAFSEDDIRIRHEFYGQQYALYTPESVEAVRWIKTKAAVKLEGTYTGKTFAALLHDARNGTLAGKKVLFWNTYNSRDYTPAIENIDYHRLPKAFHSYFEQEVQPLDLDLHSLSQGSQMSQMSHQPTIRETQPDEIPIISLIIRESFKGQAAMQGITSEQYPNFVEFTDDETVRQAIETGNVPHLLIVEGQPVGTIWHKIDREDPTIGHVRKLAVLPAYRGRGYGEMLFAYAESKLRESGAHISRLKCNDNLPRLHAYYERLGYHKTATEQFASLPFAVLTMEKLL